MWRSVVILLFVGLLTSSLVKAQIDSVQTPETPIYFHKKNPKIAGTLSTFVPGAGQIYNGSYYKLPIIYGMATTFLYYAKQNNSLYNEFLVRYSSYGLPGPTIYYNEKVPIETIKRYKEYYRRNRDLLYIMVGATYLMNILDAVVDAHLSYFDVGNDFAINVQPQLTPSINAKPIYGLSFAINF
jgi:hypothetical protein